MADEYAAGVSGTQTFVFKKFCDAVGGDLSDGKCKINDFELELSDNVVTVALKKGKVEVSSSVLVGEPRWKLLCKSPTEGVKVCTLESEKGRGKIISQVDEEGFVSFMLLSPSSSEFTKWY